MSFDVRLMDWGPNKIHTIKALRSAFPPMGLYEAKTTADKVPLTISRGVSTEEVNRIRPFFAGVARLEVVPNRTNLPLAKYNRADVVLPDVGPLWVDSSDLKYGEIVSTVSPSNAGREDLRIVTEGGIINLEGKVVSNFSDGTSYQRLPVGTKVTLTVT